MTHKLQVAVIVENHPYDVVGFQKMLDSFIGCEFYVQPFDLFAQDEDNKDKYDAVLFYSMHWDCPPEDNPVYKYVENELGSGHGIIILHHALLSFQGWDLFTEVTGQRNRGGDGFKFTQNETVNCKILDTGHPITEDISDFTVVDETYIMGEPEEPGNTILMTTDNETSIKNIAWTRQYKASRVFCYASGHDDSAYQNDSFQKVLRNGILWCARRL